MSAAGCAVVTLAHGRHEHLHRQIEGLLASSVPPDTHVVVAMNDPDLASDRVPLPATPWPRHTVALQWAGSDLPLAAARNAGVRAAADVGCEQLVLLDVDCIPTPHLVGTYRRLLTRGAARSPALWCGTVAYLPEPLPTGVPLSRLSGRLAAAPAHPARPAPESGVTLPETRFELFWSLSFAMTRADYEAVGGFCEEYVGYGGEDTDFAYAVRARGGSLTWTGDAAAAHQFHESHDPPLAHVASIVRNARLFHDRWGWWPMRGWLEAFAERGLICEGPAGWEVS